MAGSRIKYGASFIHYRKLDPLTPSLTIDRLCHLALDAVGIVEVHATAAALGQQADAPEALDRIVGIVLVDAVAVVVQAGLFALEQCQPAFAGMRKPSSPIAFKPRFC